jgi:hypothetical protein
VTTPGHIIGVYDADGTIVGEISYWLGARLGVRHCALCDVTHGLFRRRREWDEQATRLGLPFVTHHRDDAPREVLDACRGGLPAVLLRNGDAVTLLLGPEEIRGCGADAAALVDRILSKLGN